MNSRVNASEDEDLLSRAQRGDRDAFAVLVERYWDGLYGWLSRMTRSTHLAEDLTQETFCRAWTSLGSYRPGPGVKPWLFRIAHNACIDHQRRSRTILSEHLAETAIDSERPVLETMLEEERTNSLQQAIAALPAEYREALLLRCEQSLSFAEIASIVGAKEETVRWRVYKARRLLLKQLTTPAMGEEK